jgi:hypothetical protein
MANREPLWDDEEDMGLKQRVQYTLTRNLSMAAGFIGMAFVIFHFVFPAMADHGILPAPVYQFESPK